MSSCEVLGIAFLQRFCCSTAGAYIVDESCVSKSARVSTQECCATKLMTMAAARRWRVCAASEGTLRRYLG